MQSNRIRTGPELIHLRLILPEIRAFGQFHGNKSAEQLVCEHFYGKFEAKWRIRQPDPNVLEYWEKAQTICPAGAYTGINSMTLTEFVTSSIEQTIENLADSPNRDAALDEILSQILFVRSFNNSTAYEAISDKASLERFVYKPPTYEQLYPYFKTAFDACLEKYNNETFTTPGVEELQKLTEELGKILPTISDDFPSNPMGEEQQKFYLILQKTKEVSIEKLFFEYYQDILRQKFKTTDDDFQDTFDKARQVCSTKFEEVYGSITNIEDLDDCQLSMFLSVRFTSNSPLQDNANETEFRNLISNGNFLIFPSTPEFREYLLWANSIYQSQIYPSNLFASNNFQKEKFFNALCKYCLERKRYITTVFTSEPEAEAALAHLEPFFDKVHDPGCGWPETLTRVVDLPKKAVINKPPVICSSEDEKFIEQFQTFLKQPGYRMPYDKFSRPDFDGKLVPYNQFYSGTFDNFRKRLFQYVAGQLDKDPAKRKPEDYKCAVLGPNFDPSLFKLKSEIDQFVDKPST